ncbi:hypothetical protein [Nocardia sp. NPDC004604]|uniref:hypothetical protein n=1 Tax=Nocardia sp. NPDC004604 TaxID=3157013 RepID=UPI0033AD2D1F
MFSLITPTAKLVTYPHWVGDAVRIDPARPQEFELYDHATEHGRSPLGSIK